MGALAVFMLAAVAVLVLSGGSGAGVDTRMLNRQGPWNGRGSGGTAARPGMPSRDGLADADQPAGVVQVPLLLDLLGTALESGLTIQNALHVVASISGGGMREALLRVAAGLAIGASWQDAWEGNTGSSELAQIHAALSFGALTGAGAAPLLYAEAAQIRKAGGRQAEKRAAALGVKLVLPLGLCSLPAFVALGVVPVVIAMVPAF